MSWSLIQFLQAFQSASELVWFRSWFSKSYNLSEHQLVSASWSVCPFSSTHLSCCIDQMKSGCFILQLWRMKPSILWIRFWTVNSFRHFDIWYDSLYTGSAHHRPCPYSGQHNTEKCRHTPLLLVELCSSGPGAPGHRDSCCLFVTLFFITNAVASV
jgi:hypothetical protein